MKRDNMFSYENGYTYAEYKSFCDTFKGVKLAFIKKYQINLLVADYVFCVSNKRIQTKKRDILKRFIGANFNYMFNVDRSEKVADTAFVFTGDGIGRPDYIHSLNKVAQQMESKDIFIIDRKKKRFSFDNFFNLFKIFVWTIQLNRKIHKISISFDMATSLFRADRQANLLDKHYLRNKYKTMVTYCDQWSIESAITQRVRQEGVQTVTLQHGNGTEIFYGFCSDWYLCNSLMSKYNALECGIFEGQLKICGPMKYAGDNYQYAQTCKIQKIGVVFDGANNDQSNLELLKIAHFVAQNMSATCLIRFHPNNQRQLYTIHLQENDFVCEDLKEFEDAIDVCLVYNSTLYTDMLYKKKFVYRYKNGKIDLFPQLSQAIFSTAEELKTLLLKVEAEYESSLLEQKKLYNQVYGEEGTRRTYKVFFEMIRRNNERTFN